MEIQIAVSKVAKKEYDSNLSPSNQARSGTPINEWFELYTVQIWIMEMKR